MLEQQRKIKILKKETVDRAAEESRSKLYSAYCRALSVALELAHLLGVKSCDKCGRKVA